MLLFLPFYGMSQTIPSYSMDTLLSRIHSSADTVYVVNLWATWCGPCIRELPEFDKLYEDNKEKPVKILMVSLDYKADMSYKVPNYIQRRKMQQEVVWLNENNPSSFMPRLDKNWRGAIPATLVVYGKKNYRQFIQGSVRSEEIQTLIDKQLE